MLIVNGKIIVITLLLVITSLKISAHQVWLERDNNGPVRIYIGELGEPEVGNELEKIAGVQVFSHNRQILAELEQKNDHLQAIVTDTGDARLHSDNVWQPWEINQNPWWQFWKTNKTMIQGGIIQARVGRTETVAKLTYELVPTRPNGNVFTATFAGSPLANKSISLLTPSKKYHEFTTDEFGQIEIKSQEIGRYILSTAHTINEQAIHSNKNVDSLMYISTLSYIIP